jgi:four helix bundle protein
MVDGKIQSFEQLIAWQESQKLAVLVYKITKTFPKEEMFGITNQLRRAASSTSANIAAGFGRQTKNDKLHFLVIAYGSLLETKNFLYLAEKLSYISEEELKLLVDQCISCQKLINAYKKAINS